MVLLVITVFLLMLLLDLPSLLLKKQWRELSAHLALWLLGFGMSFLSSIGVKLPSPVKAIEYFIHLFIPLKQ